MLILLAGAATQPADPTMDWLLSQAATAPATPSAPPPASRPVSPFQAPQQDPETRRGTVTLSTGQVIKGPIATTREKPIRVWDAAEKEYRDVPLSLIRTLEANVLWERDEKEWHFIESGSDIKEYSGKTYPARELQYTVTLLNGQTITGGIVAPLYVGNRGEQQTLVLHKRQKGPIGQKLTDLAYVQRVDLEP